MARFRCRTCHQEGTWAYDPERYTCPVCDSIDVQFIIPRDEVPEGDPLLDAANSLSQKGNESSSPSKKVAD